MSQARVEDIEIIRLFRLSLQKFQEATTVALTEAESDLVRTTLWIETEQTPYWNGQVRKRTALLAQAHERLRMKKLFTDSTGSKPSTIDEEKAVKKAQMQLEEANLKVAAVASWRRRMEKVSHEYRGSVQRFATTIQSTVPAEIARLEVMVRQLQQYVGFRPAEVTSAAEGVSSSLPSTTASGMPLTSMIRGEGEKDLPAEQVNDAAGIERTVLKNHGETEETEGREEKKN